MPFQWQGRIPYVHNLLYRIPPHPCTYLAERPCNVCLLEQNISREVNVEIQKLRTGIPEKIKYLGREGLVTYERWDPWSLWLEQPSIMADFSTDPMCRPDVKPTAVLLTGRSKRGTFCKAQ